MEAFKIFGTIAINNAGANKAIAETSGLAEGLSKTFGKIGSAALKIGAVAGAGFTAAAAGAGMLMKKSIQSYSEYEQLEGGVKKLFGDSSDTMLKYAQEAYKTAGMSANQYMSQATSFAASLIQSVGGDTAKAADVANMAMQDMADNANTFGTDMQSIQNAYQGFSKQNYTMLDNLKLGYGGTRSEMQRLLKDAQKIQKQNGVNVKYNIKNLDDIYEAIHVIQEANGIAGTTAAEAAETVAGSWTSAKAAWDNLLVGMADGTQDMDSLIDSFADAAATTFKNVAKLLPTISTGIGKLVEGIAPQIPGMVEELFPSVLNGAVALFGGLAKSLPSIVSSLAGVLSNLFSEESVAAGAEIIAGIYNGITGSEISSEDIEEALNNIIDISGYVVENTLTFIKDVFTWIKENGAFVAVALGSIALGVTAIRFAADPIGTTIQLIIGLCAILIANWQQVKQWGINAWNGICNAIDLGVRNMLSFLGIEVPEDWSFLKTVTDAWDSICGWISDAIALVGEFLGLQEKANDPSKRPQTVTQAQESGMSLKEIHKGLADGTITGDGARQGQTFGGGSSSGNGAGASFAKGGVFSKPTFFDTRLGKTLVGEAGAEAVAPIDVLQGYVAAAVASQNAGIASALERVVEAIESMDANMGGHMRDALEDTSLKVNNREFARMVKAVG